MDKMESEMFPAARVVEEMHQRQRKTAASPNTYLPQQSTTRKHSGLSSKQRSGNNVVLGRPDCTVRPEEVNNIRPKKQSTWNPQAQASTGNHAFPEHGRTDVKRRGRGTPVTETFEVKMDDFPELSGIFRNQEIRTTISRDCWGLPPPPMDEYSESAFKMNRNSLSSNYKQSKNVGITSSWEHAQELKNGSTCMTSSWANVASQPPKQPIVKEISKPIELGEEVPELTETTGKKKRKKKKKKGKGTDEDTETESDKQLLNQDPPKFEDEEEFPGLKPGFTWTEKSIKSKTTNLCNNGNPTQSNQQQLKDQKNVKQSAKSPFIESSKAQKTEKVSGKKSKVPVQLDIGNMLAVLEKKQSQKAKQDTKPLTVSVGGGLPLVPKQQPVQKKSWVQDKVAHNPLDSTSPLVKKGKQREVPKAKKPTALKKVILKEREERKQRRLLEEKGLPLTECDSAPAEDTEEDNGQTDAADGAPCPTEEEVCSAETNDNSNEEKGEDEETVQEQTSTLANSADLPKIHSRKFREYCTQMLSKEVDECVTALLKELVRFQDRLYQKDPMKARMKRRIVMGLREVLKHLKLRKVKCVIISPDCERSQSKGGLDEALHAVFDLCQEQEVPFVFALSRKALGRCVNKVVPVTLVGIFNFDGAQDIYHKMIELSSEARKAYEAMLLSLEQTETEREEEQPLKPDQKDTVSDVTQSPEPEYLKLWKKLLEKESSHTFLNFEAELSSMCLESERTELSDDGGVS